MSFPSLIGTSLLGDEVRLPADLPAERTLVLCAFKQHQQAQVDRWIERAVRELGVAATPLGLAAGAGTAVIEVPCLGRQWRPMRRLIDGGMASSIAQPPILARTITVYGDVGAILKAIGAPQSGRGPGARRAAVRRGPRGCCGRARRSGLGRDRRVAARLARNSVYEPARRV